MTEPAKTANLAGAGSLTLPVLICTLGIFILSGMDAAMKSLVIAIGGWMAKDGQISIGTVVAFVLLLQNLFEPVQQLSQLFNMIQSAGASLHKLYELLDEPVDVPESAAPVELARRGRVDVELPIHGSSR